MQSGNLATEYQPTSSARQRRNSREAYHVLLYLGVHKTIDVGKRPAPVLTPTSDQETADWLTISDHQKWYTRVRYRLPHLDGHNINYPCFSSTKGERKLTS